LAPSDFRNRYDYDYFKTNFIRLRLRLRNRLGNQRGNRLRNRRDYTSLCLGHK
jgi:hypothetical protein